MQTHADIGDGSIAILAIVVAQVGFDICRRPVKPIDGGEVHAMLGKVRLPFAFVPVPHLYTYFKCADKGECGVGMVKGR